MMPFSPLDHSVRMTRAASALVQMNLAVAEVLTAAAVANTRTLFGMSRPAGLCTRPSVPGAIAGIIVPKPRRAPGRPIAMPGARLIPLRPGGPVGQPALRDA